MAVAHTGTIKASPVSSLILERQAENSPCLTIYQEKNKCVSHVLTERLE